MKLHLNPTERLNLCSLIKLTEWDYFEEMESAWALDERFSLTAEESAAINLRPAEEGKPGQLTWDFSNETKEFEINEKHLRLIFEIFRRRRMPGGARPWLQPLKQKLDQLKNG